MHLSLVFPFIIFIATTAHVPYKSSLSTMSTLTSRPHLLNGSQMDKLMGYVQDLNNYSHARRGIMIPFEIGGKIVGYISPAFCEQLFSYTNVFQIVNCYDGKPNKLQFTSRIEQNLSSSVMCDDFNQVNEDLRRKGVIRGWRDELLPVTASFSGAPRLLIERAACPYYGLKAYGVHVNGFVRDAVSGRIASLWVARRAATKSTWPGMLDHIAAGVNVECNHRDHLSSPSESNNSSGGQPYGIGVMDNVVKECKEEAGIDEELARRAEACGAVSYNVIDENNHLKRDALFCFDLELPKDFVPVPVDGEVECFQLQPLEWVLERVIEGGESGYKPNCNLVLMDFFISVINNFSYALQLHKQPCPSVYVYDLGSDFYGEFGFNYSEYIRRGLDTRELFAKPCSVRGTYESRYHVQFETSRIILYRLFHSKRCRLESDPSKADLFFVPLYPGPYGTIPMLRQCQKQSQFPALRYLTQQTLPFHFMYVNQPELKCWLGKEPISPLLEDILRLAYGNVYRHNQTSVADRLKFNKNADNFGPYEHSTQLEHLVQDDVFAPHMVSLPFPSSVHWDKKVALEDAPWVSAPRVSKAPQRPKRHRSYLMSFTGSFRNCTYGQVRPYLEKVFRDCPADLCATALKENEGTFQAKGQQFCSYIYLKMQSVFCVEPGGDNPWRKSFWDSLTAGCIPVIFSPYNLIVAPWHWQALAPRASVYVNATDFVNGRIDLIEMLQAIPRSKVLEMQNVISHYGHQWQWSLDDFKNDAFELTLKGVHQYAKRRSKQGRS